MLHLLLRPQLDIITRTISILDNRLTLTEDRISNLLAHSRGLAVANARTVVSSDNNTKLNSSSSFLAQQQHSDDEDEPHVQDVGQLDGDDDDSVEGGPDEH